MTKRIGSPDTAADIELRACLDEQPTRSFVMVAGAGSGKTTSLVKALAHLEQAKGSGMRKRGQQIACVTFTEIAVEEIRGDVGNAKLFHVSTIHSFLWTLAHSFQEDIRVWVEARIQEKITDAQERINKPRTRATTIAALTEDLARYNFQLTRLPAVLRFRYGTGSNYAEGLLGHDDILRLSPALIERYPLMRSVVAQRFPYIFVDESQDTNPDVVDAFKRVAQMPGIGFCVGFFGDPMQKIYMAGAGAIALEAGWSEITKPENFRCPLRVVDVINAIRAEDDALQQIPAPRIGPGGPIPTLEGRAKLFIVPVGMDRTARLAEVRRWMADNNADPLWRSDGEDGNVKLLVLVHRIAARRLGFPDLYAALNDHDSTSMKEGLLEGTAWVSRPFMEYLLPLIAALHANEDFEVMSLLRKFCPLLTKERLLGQDVAAVLAQLQANVTTLAQMLDLAGTFTIREVITFVRQRELAQLDDRFAAYLQGAPLPVTEDGDFEPDEDSGDEASVTAFLAVPAGQLWGYRTYVEDQSPFSTQQGIKGAEFQRVLVILDDEESEYRLFSYSKYWGIESPSATDLQHIANHEDSVIGRTRRLFYVCCSRAIKDLAGVFFAPNVASALTAIAAKGIFRPEDIQVLN